MVRPTHYKYEEDRIRGSNLNLYILIPMNDTILSKKK